MFQAEVDVSEHWSDEAATAYTAPYYDRLINSKNRAPTTLLGVSLKIRYIPLHRRNKPNIWQYFISVMGYLRSSSWYGGFDCGSEKFLVTMTVVADSVTVSFDNTYDTPGGSLATVACSDGSNGLLSRFPTFGNLPTFPNIGGAQASSRTATRTAGRAGSWRSTARRSKVRPSSIFLFHGGGAAHILPLSVLAVDHVVAGFNIAQEVMDTLTGGQAVVLGRIMATATQLAVSACGL
ncbi:hypothetical protein JB92DRAFT_2827972 [Gautieria morchelliformis]|nr:hypothetical protein JB92DRAFT_2827972 [Gautieria morchelliformis]